MNSTKPDNRSPERRAREEQIASEPHLPPLKLSEDAAPSAMEARLPPSHPRAMMGVVEKGLVRPLDPSVELPEHSRVIIVATQET